MTIVTAGRTNVEIRMKGWGSTGKGDRYEFLTPEQALLLATQLVAQVEILLDRVEMTQRLQTKAAEIR